ncbi:quinolinate synthase NadA [Oceanidesulfovibrio indonesiensis]|uniref:quinolinate synthase n=1 Tax=Oceanidesulfovibrio indonesiensis TaxID=54767 RepID=A0A7M3MGF5_9BACT|nr:quinolinate synthase NadA [Oceanidesulfovibrio indonesiensis]TVM18339.1 quinolinate synthase NadA [Oceanidesulfovibrio indonesiensis]
MSNATQRIQDAKNTLGSDLVILGHHYQHDSVIQHCDLTGDSLELARNVAGLSSRYIVFCGVIFMGESAALLVDKNQQVFMPDLDASCIMSDMAPDPVVYNVLEQLKKSGKKVVPLTYVNSSAAVKAVVGAEDGASCTSANAGTMLQWCLDRGDSVLFLPDKNLALNTADVLGIPDAERRVIDITRGGRNIDPNVALGAKLLIWPGCCAIHSIRMKVSHIEQARAAHPDCTIIVHPECSPEVVQAADVSGSTSKIIKYCEEAPAGATIYIGTEINLVERLMKRFAGEKTIIPLQRSACKNMAKNTEDKLAFLLEDLVQAHRSGTPPKAEPVTVDDETAANARLCLERMLEACS